jgi:hypothetical protein
VESALKRISRSEYGALSENLKNKAKHTTPQNKTTQTGFYQIRPLKQSEYPPLNFYSIPYIVFIKDSSLFYSV